MYSGYSGPAELSDNQTSPKQSEQTSQNLCLALLNYAKLIDLTTESATPHPIRLNIL